MVPWIIGLVLAILAALLFRFRRRGGGAEGDSIVSSTTTSFAIAGEPPRVLSDPEKLIALPGERVAWEIDNQTPVELEVELIDFKLEGVVVEAPFTPPTNPRTVLSGNTPARVEAIVAQPEPRSAPDAAPRGAGREYTYAIQIRAGGETSYYNTPRLQVVDP